jgi:hypothetical protein
MEGKTGIPAILKAEAKLLSAAKPVNAILGTWGWGTAFRHSFRIGGASFYLAQEVNPEIVRLAGRWKSLAYGAYIRAFEQIASRHMSNLATQSA